MGEWRRGIKAKPRRLQAVVGCGRRKREGEITVGGGGSAAAG